MQKIIPHLWFDTQAKEAAAFYTSIFPNSKITQSTKLHNTPSGDVDSIAFELSGYSFMAISAGPLFKFNPSISFMLNFDPAQDKKAQQHLDELWEKLADGGQVLMPLQKYDFSELYGWIQDKYGVSWQLILTNPAGEPRPFIVPTFLFVGPAAGKAKEAVDAYLSVFKNSQLGTRQFYGEGQQPNQAGTVMFSDFMLENQWFVAMDGGSVHHFEFNEAISLLVNCDTQQEVDYYWEKLSAVPESEQCGWLKDSFGVSWQISPTVMNEMMAKGSEEQIARVTEAFLKMKKFDIAQLQAAYEGDT
jgi:predicted 3-demethylubiquinone-9 3-methyltransferase (glyoxalase superfamily)